MKVEDGWMDGWIGRWVGRRKKLGLRGFKWFACVDTARNGGVSIWKQVTCLQTLRLMHDITEPKSKVKENQLESFEPGVAHSNLTEHVTLDIMVGVSMWCLSDGCCLGPSHFIQIVYQTFGKDLQPGK